MRKQINLIPSELTVPTRTVKLSAFFYKVTTIGAILFVVSFISIGLILYLTTQQYNSKVLTANSLKAQVKTLEGNEQKLILAKDRLSKINEIKRLNLTAIEIGNLNRLIEIFSIFTDSIVTEISLATQKTELTFISNNSVSLSNVTRSIVSLGIYKNVVISSVTYNSNSGYLVSMILNNN